MSLTPFAFIDGAHPFASQLERFRTALRADPRCEQLLHDGRDERPEVHAEIKGMPTASGGWNLDRFYWCLQVRTCQPPTDFTALTLYYSAQDDRLEWHTFPNDPYLTRLGRGLKRVISAAPSARAEVLRYVPVRRLTLRTDDPATGLETIAKFKRRSRLEDSYLRLAVVARAVQERPVSFAIPAPCGVDAENGVFFQSSERGQNLARLLETTNVERHLARLGAIQRELHEVLVPELPEHALDPLAELRRNARWITFFRPDVAPVLEQVSALTRRLAFLAEPGESALCHGDFVCSQVLVAGARWTLTDFDSSHRGDPYRDIAIFLASLPYDVPLFGAHSDASEAHEIAINAYLEGYQQRAGRALDRVRLLWHRLMAEVYYLALMFKKDTYQPLRFERGLERIRSLSAQLAHEKKENL